MLATTFVTLMGLLLGADACFVRCTDGTYHDVGLFNTPCPGKQAYVNAGPGFADIVYFDGGKAHQCADSEGFSLANIKENIIGCDNGVQGRCCGSGRC